MDPILFFLVISGIAFYAALESGLLLLALLSIQFLVPDFLWASTRVMLYLAALMLAVTIVAVSGVPAALYERLAARPRGDDITMLIWTISAALLATGCFWLGGGNAL